MNDSIWSSPGMVREEKLKYCEKKCVPAPLCYNCHTGLAWDQTWSCMVRG